MENDLNCHAVKIDLKQRKHQGTNSCYNQVNGTSGAGLVIAFALQLFLLWNVILLKSVYRSAR